MRNDIKGYAPLFTLYYEEFFNGQRREIGKKTRVDWKKADNFLGQLRRAYNQGKNSQLSGYADFSQELEYVYKNKQRPPPPPINLKHNNQTIQPISPPKGFTSKTLCRNNWNMPAEYIYFDNWGEVESAINVDIPILDYAKQIPTPTRIMPVAVGIRQLVEIYDISGNLIEKIHKGISSGICITKTILIAKIATMVQIQGVYYDSLKKSQRYQIVDSDIDIFLYSI